ncbi:MAG: hypothetical protein GX074_02490 [Erysipelothrix sp.]|nr:hypothetical protein [Erysipelothrix sp.]
MKYSPIYGYKTKDYSLHKLHLRGRKQVLTFSTQVSGDTMRILFTNKYSHKSLRVMSVNMIINGNSYPIKVAGKTSFKMPAHTEYYSDEIKLPYQDLSAVVINARFGLFASAYGSSDFKSHKIINATHRGMLNRKVHLGLSTKAISDLSLKLVALIKQVEIVSDQKSIAWFGDSLTNHSHYTQPLQARLFEAKANINIVNAGHSGNRLLHDGSNILKEEFGIAAINRFYEDVMEYNTPDLVVVALGVNDLIHPGRTSPQDEMPSLQDMIDGYLNLHDQIRAKNAKAVITTITPFGGYSNAILDYAEELRLAINVWIKNQKDFDHVIDINAIVEDPDNPGYLKDEFKGHDNLHWEQIGGQIIADSIDLESLIKLVNEK